MNLTPCEMKTTLGKIRSFNPCSKGWKKLIGTLGTSDPYTEVTLLQILDNNGPKDAFWVLRCWSYEDYRTLLADVAESVLHIFESKYPNDDRPRKAVEAARATGDVADAAAAAAAGARTYAAYAAYAADAADAADAAYVAAADQWQKNEQLMRNFIEKGENR